MIYAGILNSKFSKISEGKLIKAVGSFTQGSPSILQKGELILCYGKLSNDQDMDEVLENDSAILMGRVFDKNNSIALKEESFKDLHLLKKEEFLSRVWGKYVYIKSANKADHFEIILDPTGQLPFFYYLLSDGSILFSSDIEIICKILAQKPDYNWEYLCSYMVYGNSSSVQTPFKGVFEVPPACCLQVTGDKRQTTPFWNPLESYNDLKEKKENAVNVLQKTLKPWVDPYKNIVVSLSGGLDSSSLVYCLKDILEPQQTLKAINYFHSEIKSSNELVHARKVCEETKIELIEIDVSACLPFDLYKNKNSLKANKPFPGMISQRWIDIIYPS